MLGAHVLEWAIKLVRAAETEAWRNLGPVDMLRTEVPAMAASEAEVQTLVDAVGPCLGCPKALKPCAANDVSNPMLCSGTKVPISQERCGPLPMWSGERSGLSPFVSGSGKADPSPLAL